MDKYGEKTKDEEIKYSVEQIIKYRPAVLKNKRDNKIANALIAGTAALGILYANILVPNVNSSKFLEVVDVIIQASISGAGLAAILAKINAVKNKIKLSELLGSLTNKYYVEEIKSELNKRVDEIKQQEKETGGMSR